MDHTKKFVVKPHLDPKKHKEKAVLIPAADAEEQAQQRMTTMKYFVKYRSQTELQRKELAVDYDEALLKANIPVYRIYCRIYYRTTLKNYRISTAYFPSGTAVF